MREYFLVCFLMCWMQTYGGKDLPTDFPRCRRSDKNFNDCIFKALEAAKPFIAKGLPEINLPPFEPYFSEKVFMKLDTEALKYEANLTNVFLHGFTDYTCPTFQFDVPISKLVMRCLFNEIRMEANYVIKGKLLGATLDGTGNFTAKFGKAEGNVTEAFSIGKKRGVDYLRGDKTNLSIAVGRMTVQIERQGDKKFGEVMGKLINDNSDELFRQATPLFEELLTDVADNVVLKAFTQVPRDKLFL